MKADTKALRTLANETEVFQAETDKVKRQTHPIAQDSSAASLQTTHDLFNADEEANQGEALVYARAARLAHLRSHEVRVKELMRILS